MQVIDLNIVLADLPYEVRRRLTVPAAVKLTDLHMLLQAAMGWENAHLYDFTCGRDHRWADGESFFDDEDNDKVQGATLADILAVMGRQKQFIYTYDMGDSWEHLIKPGKPRDPVPGQAAIALLEAVGAGPPEDSGGAPGFSYMLDCIEDPASDDHEHYLEWLGGPFDRQADMAALTARFDKLAKRLAKAYPG